MNEEIVEVYKEDRPLLNKEAKRCWFHSWSFWYRILISFAMQSNMKYMKQERQCLECGFRQQREIR